MPDTSNIVLVLVCLLVSLFNASVGTTGGVTFAAMATVLPPAAVVPIHGLVEGTASAFRWAMLREYVNYRFLAAFAAGGLLGFLAGWPLIGRFSDEGLKILLGAFILFTAWAPLGWMRFPPALSGVLTSSLTVMVGATGPLVAAIIARHESDHRFVIGTQGACTAFQHGGKALLFAVWGFSFVAYTGLIIALIMAIVTGTWLGKRILLKASQRVLRLSLKVIVTMLGLRLLFQGLGIRLVDVPVGSWTGGAIVLIAVIVGCHIAYRLGAGTARKSRSRGSNRRRVEIEDEPRNWPRYVTFILLVSAAAILVLSSSRFFPIESSRHKDTEQEAVTSGYASKAVGLVNRATAGTARHAPEPLGARHDNYPGIALRYSRTLDTATQERSR